MARSQRYTDEQLLEELRECAARLGRSPTMREFSLDPEVVGVETFLVREA